MSCVWARFLIDSHTMPGQWHSQPTPTCWVKLVYVFRCNLLPALLAEWQGSLTCHWGNTGVERTPNKSQHTKLTLEKKIRPPLLPGFELATFRSRVRHSNQQAIDRAIWSIFSVSFVSFFFFFWRAQAQEKDRQNQPPSKRLIHCSWYTSLLEEEWKSMKLNELRRQTSRKKQYLGSRQSMRCYFGPVPAFLI